MEMKAPKFSRNIDEMCYPFMYEASLKCDYEILTDDLCRQIGGILSEISEELEWLRPELEHLQPLIYHLNGSIRGKCAVTEDDHAWLLERYRIHKVEIENCLSSFVLPRGASPVPQLNRASSDSKKVIRLMLRLQVDEGVPVPELLFRFCNLLCNYFFVLTLVVNKGRGLPEIPFTSASYGQ